MAASASSNLALGEIVVPLSENVTLTEMENFIREMDISMDRISFSGGEFLRKLIPEAPAEADLNFFRSSLRSLLLVGNFGELPTKGQVHPWMQKRMLYSVPEVSYSVSNSIDILKDLSDDSREEIKSALNDDPGLGMRILETLDLEAKAIGVPTARRRQMRVMGTRIMRRLRHSPGMLFDEYLRKSERLLAAADSDKSLEHLYKAQMGEANYLTCRKQAEDAALQWSSLKIPDLPVGYQPVIFGLDENPTTQNEGSVKTKKRLGLLGIGLIATAVGWLSIAIAPNWVGVILGVTVGPLLILIALIILLIRAISKSGKAGDTQL